MSYPRYQRYHGILSFRYLPYRLDQVFSDVIPAIPTIPRYFEISVPTIPARSGIFRCHTHDTHAYRGMEYPGYIPGVCRVRYLTHGFCAEYSVSASVESWSVLGARHERGKRDPIGRHGSAGFTTCVGFCNARPASSRAYLPGGGLPVVMRTGDPRGSRLLHWLR